MRGSVSSNNLKRRGLHYNTDNASEIEDKESPGKKKTDSPKVEAEPQPQLGLSRESFLSSDDSSDYDDIPIIQFFRKKQTKSLKLEAKPQPQLGLSRESFLSSDDSSDDENIPIINLQLNRSLPQFRYLHFVRICVRAGSEYCFYCDRALRVAVNLRDMVIHLITRHRFSSVDNVEGKKLNPATIAEKLKRFLPFLKTQWLGVPNDSNESSKRENITTPLNQAISKAGNETSTNTEVALTPSPLPESLLLRESDLSTEESDTDEN